MNTESLKEAIKRELPEFLRTDQDFRSYIIELTRQEYAGRVETQDRFYDLLAELRRDREGRTREWEEFKDGQSRKWDEQNRRWDETQAELRRIHEEIMLLICELKSSIDKAGMYIFERKARYYEQRHQRTANRLIVISPMIDARARRVVERLGIETYGDSSEVEAI